LNWLPVSALSAEVTAPPVVVVRDALAVLAVLARLLARCVVLRIIRRRVVVLLAFSHVAFLVLPIDRFGGSYEIFQFLRMRVGDIPPVLTLCAEVAAIFVRVERDALAYCVILARLLARREVGDKGRRFANPFLAFGNVALLAVSLGLGDGGSCEIFQFLRMRVGDRPGFLTLSAEVAAPPVTVVRDTLASCCIHARLLARREGACLARRPGYVDLAFGHVAFQAVLAWVDVLRMRTVFFHSVHTASAEVVAASVGVVRDAHT